MNTVRIWIDLDTDGDDEQTPVELAKSWVEEVFGEEAVSLFYYRPLYGMPTLEEVSGEVTA